jgi:hypothetical protein
VSTVEELLPGDLVTIGGRRAVFITWCLHPVWEHLRLVIWRLDDGGIRLATMRSGDEVGTVQPIEPAARAARLAEALHATSREADVEP